MKKSLVSFFALALVLCLCACSQPAPLTLDPAQYPDPPEAEWQYQLDIYSAWNAMGGESSNYTLSAEGIIEEGTREDPNNPDEDEFLEMPGGLTHFFRGVAPGDVQLTFSITNGNRLLDQTVYAIRVFDDLRLVILDQKTESYRT